jgi:hypothetical protein
MCEERLQLQPLLSFYDRVDLQAIAVQAAVLEEVTYVKVLGTGAKQTYTKAKSAVKWLADVTGVRNKIDSTPAKSTADLVLSRADFWVHRPADEVRRHVFSTLASRLQVGASDLGLLSTRLIEEAAAGFDVPEDLLISQQAEAVAQKYLENCIEGVRDLLKKQGDDEIKVTEDVMSKQLAAMTAAERLEIQQALNLQTLSGSSLRSVFLKSGVPVAGIAALQAGGFGTYLALSTIMHAVFTGVLGITLPFAAYTTASSAMSVVMGPVGIMCSLSIGLLGYFWGRRKIERSQYAMIVWTCVVHAGRPLEPATSFLPSALSCRLLPDGSGDAVATPQAEDDDFNSLEQESGKKAVALKLQESARKESEAAEARSRKIEERLLRAQESLAAAAAQRSENATLQESLKAMVENQLRLQAQLAKELGETRSNAATATERLNRKEQESTIAEAHYVSRLERRTSELKSLWGIHFAKVDFRQQPLRWAAEQDFVGRLEIERAIKELVDAPDPVKLSRSRMHDTHEHHSRFTIPKGVECRLFFVVSQGRIEVRRMCKKKDC